MSIQVENTTKPANRRRAKSEGMKELNDWLQVLGNFGVIASLVFVGLQMRQDQEIAMSAAYQARSEQGTEITMNIAEIPEARSFYLKITTGRDKELTPDEIMAGTFALTSVFNLYENMHFQYANGFLTEEHWHKSVSGLTNLLRIPYARRFFFNDVAGHRNSFVELGEQLVAEIEANLPPHRVSMGP